MGDVADLLRETWTSSRQRSVWPAQAFDKLIEDARKCFQMAGTSIIVPLVNNDTEIVPSLAANN
jgi:hypothetical protein